MTPFELCLGSDFQLSENSVTFSEQVDTACIDVMATADQQVENNETFFLVISAQDPAVEILTRSALVIIDDQSNG